MRTSPTRATQLRLDERRAKDLIDLVDQQPGAAVGHAHLPACRGNRTMLGDAFHQGDLAGSEIAECAKIDADRQGGAARLAALALRKRRRPATVWPWCVSHTRPRDGCNAFTWATACHKSQACAARALPLRGCG